MKIFLASLALIIAATFVFEVHQLTKAVREPRVQVNTNYNELCWAYEHAYGLKIGFSVNDCSLLMIEHLPAKETRTFSRVLAWKVKKHREESAKKKVWEAEERAKLNEEYREEIKLKGKDDRKLVSKINEELELRRAEKSLREDFPDAFK